MARWHYAVFGVVAVAGLLSGTIYTVLSKSNSNPFADCGGGAIAGGEIGGPFTLIDEDAKTVTEADIITKPTLVYFGYTFCPDVCPMDAARNAAAVDILDAAGYDVTPIFITIDPARDTPEALRDFTANLHPKMIGLTGTEAQIKAASMAYKTYYQKQEGDPKYYLVDHSTFTYLMAPNGGFLDFFDRDATAETMATRTACFLDHLK
jgi:protein SCO1/2